MKEEVGTHRHRKGGRSIYVFRPGVLLALNNRVNAETHHMREEGCVPLSMCMHAFISLAGANVRRDRALSLAGEQEQFVGRLPSGCASGGVAVGQGRS